MSPWRPNSAHIKYAISLSGTPASSRLAFLFFALFLSLHPFGATMKQCSSLSPHCNYPSIQPCVKLIALVVQEATHLNNLLPWIETINHLRASRRKKGYRSNFCFENARRCMLLGWWQFELSGFILFTHHLSRWIEGIHIVCFRSDWLDTACVLFFQCAVFLSLSFYFYQFSLGKTAISIWQGDISYRARVGWGNYAKCALMKFW